MGIITEDAANIRQDSFPRSWSCESPQKRVKVEISVTNRPTSADPTPPLQWVEIPTTNVESWMSRDGSASKQRIAKVEFPTQWDEAGDGILTNSPLELIESFRNTGAGFTFVRIWFKNSEDDYILQHFGFAAGVGRGSSPILSKMWVYDLAELMVGVPATATFDNPTPNFVINRVSRLTNQNTPVKFTDPVILGPDSEERFQALLQATGAFLRDSDGNPIGTSIDDIREDTPFNPAAFDIQSPNPRQTPAIIDSIWESGVYGATPTQFDELFDTIEIDTGADFTGFLNIGTKRFQSNRHSVTDILTWLAEKLDAEWWIEPTPEGGTIVVDMGRKGRTFAQRQVAFDVASGEHQEFADTQIYDIITVIDNSSLYDINPINTVKVVGDTGRGFVDDLDFLDDVLGDKYTPSTNYPSVKVQATPLVQRAAVGTGSTQYAEMAIIVESNDTTIGEATATAKRVLKEEINEPSEGEIVITGTPKIVPSDYILAYPTCGDYVPETEIPPIRYEVQSVRHECGSNEMFKTRLRVSVAVDDDDMAVVEGRMVDVEKPDDEVEITPTNTLFKNPILDLQTLLFGGDE